MTIKGFNLGLPTAIFTLSMLLSFSSLADTNKEAAILLFKEGNRLRKAEKYDAALKRYRTARKLLPSYKIDYNIALTLEKMGRNVEAAQAYELFLETGKGKSPRMIKLAKKKLRGLKKKIAMVTIKCSVDGAAVLVDGKIYATTPHGLPIYLDVGPHVVSVEKTGYVTVTRSLQALAGGRLTLTFDLSKPPPKPVPVVVKPRPEPPPVAVQPRPVEVAPPPRPLEVTPGPGLTSSARPVLPEPPKSRTAAPREAVKSDDVPSRKRGRLFTWIVAGTAGALAIGGVIMGVSAQSKYSELQDRCAPSCGDEEVDAVASRVTGANVMFGLAGAAAVTAVILFFVEGRSASGKQESTSSALRLKVRPVLGSGVMGLGADVRF